MTTRLTRMPDWLPRLATVLLMTLALLIADRASAQQDPPGRIARIAAQNGTVSLAPVGEPDWQVAPMNRPMSIGDRLWVGPGGRAEIQTSDWAARIGAESLVTLLDFDDDTVQVQLSQGSMRIRIRAGQPGDVNEVATPQLAFAMMQPGDYRVDVEPSDGSTLVAVRSGRAEVSSGGTVYSIHAGRAYRFVGPGLRVYEEIPMPPADGLDAWAAEREQRLANAASAAFVPGGVLGYEELDQWGVWQSDPSYGSVWFPRAAPIGWSPYTAGRWAWIAPWGWTWIDEAPWGFAVSHYGRWARFDGRWGWVPGPRGTRAVYAPALVAFVGGPSFQLTLSSGPTRAIGWYPLAPREVYRPWYPATRTYFSRVNVTNTVIAAPRVDALYDRRDHDDERHVHRHVPGAVVVVPSAAFSRSEPVGSARVRLPDREIPAQRFTPGADLVPGRPTGRPLAQPAPGPAPSVLDRPATTRHVAPVRPSFQPEMRPAPGVQRPDTRTPVEQPRPNPRPSFDAPRQEPRPSFEAPRQEPRPSFEAPRQEPRPAFEVPRQEPRPSFETPRQEPRPITETPRPASRPAFDPPRGVQPDPVRRPGLGGEPGASNENPGRPAARPAEPQPAPFFPRPMPEPNGRLLQPDPVRTAPQPRQEDQPQPRPVEPAGPMIPERRSPSPAPIVLPASPQSPAGPVMQQPAPAPRMAPQDAPRDLPPAMRGGSELRQAPDFRRAPEARPAPEFRPAPELRPAPQMRSAPEPRPRAEPNVAPEPRPQPPQRERRD